MLAISEREGFCSLVAASAFVPGERIYVLNGPVAAHPTRTSIEIGAGRHTEDAWGQFMNHSFSPSCVIREGAIVAARAIAAGEDLTFNYNENETAMACPFVDIETKILVGGRLVASQARS